MKEINLKKIDSDISDSIHNKSKALQETDHDILIGNEFAKAYLYNEVKYSIYVKMITISGEIIRDFTFGSDSLHEALKAVNTYLTFYNHDFIDENVKSVISIW